MTNVTSLKTSSEPTTSPGEFSPAERQKFDGWFDARFEQKMREREAARTPSMAIIATKGTIDWAYPPFILASTAAALGYDVSIFFTFYGLKLLKKDLDLEVTPLGNPAMPMKMPIGPDWFRQIDWPIPNFVKSNLPGFERMATALMKRTFRQKGVASIEELRELSVEAGVKLYACQMTVDAFGFDKPDFISDIAGWVGAASFLPMAQKSDITLFI
ncbi:DsrE/DsrF/DrsH-like family protein [Rhodoblastus sp.]|uniref:sulfur carrier protein DsrE2 n=1 Tax=Rhodoblastus sp. TaxID=1962975 RepID=UPI0026346DA8|nr:DsrE/DsrF/DrsH-like family protein [Rhodoblastus sp.]